MKGLAARSTGGAGGLKGRAGPWTDLIYCSSDEEEGEEEEGEEVEGRGARRQGSRHAPSNVGLFGSMLATSAPYCLSAVPGGQRRGAAMGEGGERRGLARTVRRVLLMLL
jgi:hypothetical protein